VSYSSGYDDDYYNADPAEPEPVSPIRFVSPAELRASVPPEPPWIWSGYLARGAVTILAGKPKAGKSTLGLALANALADRKDTFLGHQLDAGPVVYASEEGAATLAHKIGDGDLRIVTRETAWPKPDWQTLVEAAAAEATRIGAAMVVIDTFAFWAALGPEAEKDAGSMQNAMAPLVEIARQDVAVLLIVHARKGGGDDGEAVRGSTALAGAADIILELERIQGGPPRQRKLLALSRYPQTPGALVAEHDPHQDQWQVIGEGSDRGDAREITDRSALLQALSHNEATTRAELQEAMGSPERQWHGTLDELISTGQVEKIGAGKKGDPYRYKILRTNDAHPPAQHRAENGGEVIPLSAHPRSGAERESTDAPSNHAAHGAGCAETDWDDHLQTLIDQERHQ